MNEVYKVVQKQPGSNAMLQQHTTQHEVKSDVSYWEKIN